MHVPKEKENFGGNFPLFPAFVMKEAPMINELKYVVPHLFRGAALF